MALPDLCTPVRRAIHSRTNTLTGVHKTGRAIHPRTRTPFQARRIPQIPIEVAVAEAEQRGGESERKIKVGVGRVTPAKVRGRPASTMAKRVAPGRGCPGRPQRCRAPAKSVGEVCVAVEWVYEYVVI
jgi:hypothetical protein